MVTLNMKPLATRSEDYLEIIYNMSREHGHAHSVDIAKTLGVSKPTVFNALQTLIEQGFVIKQAYGDVTLTDKGKSYARDVIKKHDAVKKLLVDTLKVSPEQAEIDACKIEHCLSEETTKKLFEYLGNI